MVTATRCDRRGRSAIVVFGCVAYSSAGPGTWLLFATHSGSGYRISSIPSAQIPLTSTICANRICEGSSLVETNARHAARGSCGHWRQGPAVTAHLKCLKAILADCLVVHALARRGILDGARASDALRGYIDGITPEVETAILAKVRDQSIGRIFLDGSNLGRLARAIKRTTPSVEVLTFFHNVEARFFFGALKQYRSAHALGVLAANYVSERMAVRYSDRLITLNKRDSAGIADLYGRAATDVLPMAIEDKLRIEADPPKSPLKEPYALFVGGAFYANQSGIRWFVENVVPEVNLKTCIVGRGLENPVASSSAAGRSRLWEPSIS